MGRLKSDMDLPRIGRRQLHRPHANLGGTFVNIVNPTKCGGMLLLTLMGVLLFEFLLMHSHVVQEPHNAGHFPIKDVGRPPSWSQGFPRPPGTVGSEPRGRFAATDVESTDDDKINSGTQNTPKLQDNEAVHILGQQRQSKQEVDARQQDKPWADGIFIGQSNAQDDPITYDEGRPGQADKISSYGEMRIAVLVPYSGPGLPVWFDAFTDLAAANSKLMDWIIFCEEELAQVKTPDNVKMIPTSPSELAWLLAGVVYPPNAADAPNIYIDDFRQAVEQKLTATSEPIVSNRLVATRFIQRLLEKNPYHMVEFKPALGWVFRKHLENYSHWAFGDLDVFFGDLTKGWLEPAEMQEYDFFTYRYISSERMIIYERHGFGDQNRAYLRGQLTVHKNIPRVNEVWRHCPHLSKFMQRIEETRVTRRYTLESAEGCYSAALMFSRDIKAKYAVRVFTDMGTGLSWAMEVVITGDALVKLCPSVPQRIGESGGEMASMTQMQVDVGPLVPVVSSPPGTNCEYWINNKYQTCLDLVIDEGPTNVYLMNGQYYQREYRNLWMDVVDEGCRMGAFHHFQEFKSNYRPWNTRPPMPPTHMGMVAGEGGLVPLPSGDWRTMALDPNTPPPANRDRFTHRYCMQWDVDMSKEKNAFSCQVSVTSDGALRTLHDTRSEAAMNGELTGGVAVTLGGVGRIQELGILLHSLREWTGPKILVLLMKQTDVETATAALREESNVQDSCGMENTLIVAFLVPADTNVEENSQHPLVQEVPRKSLLNALIDLCQTRHLLTLSPGFRIGRGTEDAVLTALQQPAAAPRVLVIPQWCLDPLPSLEVAPSLDIEDARRRYQEGTARFCYRGDAGNERSTRVAYPWLGAAEMGTEMGRMHGRPAKSTKLGIRSMLWSDAVNPVMVVDLWSAPALFLRHVEELTRARCFDGAYVRGLAAAGFEFHVVPDALSFVVSGDMEPGTAGCREGAEMPISDYRLFLKYVRRVYSQNNSPINDDFKLIGKDSGVAREAVQSKKNRKRPFKPFRSKREYEPPATTAARREEASSTRGEGKGENSGR